MYDLETQKLIELAKQVAEIGGEKAMLYFRAKDLTIENKAKWSFDPVTKADLESENAMRTFIKEYRPDDTIIGEELGATIGSSGYSWILDPIDGTRAFISGTPVWTVLVSVSKDGKPILGVIYQPFTKEMFVGGLGISMFFRDNFSLETQVRSCPEIKNSVLFSTFPEVGSETEYRAFNSVKERTRLTRFGMDAYAFGLLAAGHIDIVMEAGLKIHDIFAPLAVIEAAGGVVTDWSGNEIVNGGRGLACGDKTLHSKVIKILLDYA